jgi:hypothetical protein
MLILSGPFIFHCIETIPAVLGAYPLYCGMIINIMYALIRRLLAEHPLAGCCTPYPMAVKRFKQQGMKRRNVMSRMELLITAVMAQPTLEVPISEISSTATDAAGAATGGRKCRCC